MRLPVRDKIRHTGRGIVLHNGRVLLMERWRDGLHYFSIPGGGIEPGETPEQTAVREIHEETSVEVKIKHLLYEMHDPIGSIHHIFLCRYEAGQPQLLIGSEESRENELGKNRFKPQWLPIDRLGDIDLLYWEPIREQLKQDIANNFAGRWPKTIGFTRQ